jgi:hypothetical protein
MSLLSNQFISANPLPGILLYFYLTDDLLASSVEKVEQMGVPPKLSRVLIKKLIEERYTLPA